MSTRSFLAEDAYSSASAIAVGGVLIVAAGASLLLIGPGVVATVAVAEIIAASGLLAGGSALIVSNVSRPLISLMPGAPTTEQWSTFNKQVKDYTDVEQLLRNEIAKTLSTNPDLLLLAPDAADLIKSYADLASHGVRPASTAKALANKVKASMDALEHARNAQKFMQNQSK